MKRPQARVGDRLALPPRVAGGAVRTAIVVEVMGDDGSPPFLLRWDDGSQTIVYPSTAAYMMRPGSDGRKHDST